MLLFSVYHKKIIKLIILKFTKSAFSMLAKVSNFCV